MKIYTLSDDGIKAVGTSSKKIVFESNNSSQNKSDWSGIRIRPSSSTQLMQIKTILRISIQICNN